MQDLFRNQLAGPNLIPLNDSAEIETVEPGLIWNHVLIRNPTLPLVWNHLYE